MEETIQPVIQQNIGIRPVKLNIIKLEDVKSNPQAKIIKLKIVKPALVKPKIICDVDNTVEIPVVDETDNERSMYLMFDGTFKSPKDLVIGDKLMGVDSLPCTITSITSVVEKNYMIRPVKGDSFLMGESETLVLTYSGGKLISWREERQCYCLKWFNVGEKRQTSKHFTLKTYKTKELALMATEEFKSSLPEENNFDMKIVDFKKSKDVHKWHSKIYKVDLNFENDPFEIDPYIIGFWLGDGTSANTGVTTIDPEIIEFFTDYFSHMNLSLTQNRITYNITSNSPSRYPGQNRFLNYLKEKKLLNNKHIPLEFLLSSRTDRLKLLAGLLDSDGSLTDNCYDFIQKREHLLARSLGFSAYKKACTKICTNSSRGRVAGTYYRCCISGEGLEEIPLLLARKTASKRKQIKRTTVNGITLEDVGIRSNYRIITDKPLFLMADFTVRHRFEK